MFVGLEACIDILGDWARFSLPPEGGSHPFVARDPATREPANPRLIYFGRAWRPDAVSPFRALRPRHPLGNPLLESIARAGKAARRFWLVRGDEVAVHRPAPGQPDGRGCGASAAAVHVLHGAGQRRRLEDDRRRDGPGIRSSTISRPGRSAPSRWRPRIPTSSTSAAAKACTARICRPANGVYKSTDAGRTWTHLGLPDAQQIPGLAIDPRNPDRVFVAALGHPYGPNEERGVFRSTRRRPHVPEGALQGREHRRQ